MLTILAGLEVSPRSRNLKCHPSVETRPRCGDLSKPCQTARMPSFRVRLHHAAEPLRLGILDADLSDDSSFLAEKNRACVSARLIFEQTAGGCFLFSAPNFQVADKFKTARTEGALRKAFIFVPTAV